MNLSLSKKQKQNQYCQGSRDPRADRRLGLYVRRGREMVFHLENTRTHKTYRYYFG
jgi:hypothetical protein